MPSDPGLALAQALAKLSDAEAALRAEQKAAKELRRRLEAAEQSVSPEGRHREEQLRLAIEAAGLGTFEIDVIAGLVRYSPELAEMLGFPGLRETQLELAMARVHRDDQRLVRDRLAATLSPAGDGKLLTELRFVRPGGEVRWMTWNGRVEFEGRGRQRRAVRILGACADITERKLAEDRLRESEARFRALVELSTDWYWEQGPDLRFVAISDPVVALAGSSAASHLGKLRWELPAVGVSDAQWAEHRAMLERREAFRNFEYRRLNEKGETIWMSVNGDPFFDARGRFLGYRGTGHNITERKTATLSLTESEARFRLLADSAPVLIWVSGGDGGVFFNRTYVSFVGADSERELAGMAWAEYLHPDDRRAYIDAFLVAEARRGQFEAQVRMRRADGRYRWMKSIALARLATDGTYLGYVGSTLDITDVKENEERIELLMRELDHRVKNTLARFEAVIERTGDTPLTTPEFVTALKHRIESMSRAHAMLSREHWAGAPLRALVADQLEAYATDSNLSIAGPDLVLTPDAAQAIAMVINELATNAAKYGALSTPAGRVEIRWRRRRRQSAGEPRGLTIEWSEHGGQPVPQLRRDGYGTSVIKEILAHELGGVVDLQFPPSGLTCKIVLPLAGVEADHSPATSE